MNDKIKKFKEKEFLIDFFMFIAFMIPFCCAIYFSLKIILQNDNMGGHVHSELCGDNCAHLNQNEEKNSK